MRVRSILYSLLIVLVVSGCASTPYDGYLLSETIIPNRVRESFALSSPKTFELLSSVVFKYRGHSMSAMGYTSVDIPEERFHLSGMNQFGLTLFSVSGEGDEIVCDFGMEEFLKRGDFKQVIADVVTSVYFNTIPSVDATVDRSLYALTFRAPLENGLAEYVFAGPDTRLVEKRFFEKRRKVWTVRYSDYLERDAKLYPETIVFQHHRYNYTITLYLKEICT